MCVNKSKKDSIFVFGQSFAEKSEIFMSETQILNPLVIPPLFHIFFTIFHMEIIKLNVNIHSLIKVD